MTVNLERTTICSKKIVNDPIDVFVKYAIEKPYGFAKAVYVLGVDLLQAIGLMAADNAAGKLVKKHFTLVKLVRSPALLLNQVHTIIGRVWAYFNGSDIKATAPQIFRDGLGLVNPVAEVMGFFSQAILFIPKASLHTLKGVNGVALFILMGWGVVEKLDRFDSANLAKKTHTMRELDTTVLNLAIDISYFALGILTSLFVFGSIVVPSVVMTALSVNAVIFTILEFYHRDLGQEKQLT